MPLDLHGIHLESVAVHEIRKGTGGATAVLTDQLSDLDDDLRAFFQKRIIQVASSDDSFRAQFKNQTESPVPELCRELLTTARPDLLAASRSAARHLASVQTGANSGGLLLVGLAKHTGAPALIFMKLEHDQGVRIEREDLPDGKHIVRLQHVRDLILSERTKLFKQAFVQRSEDAYFLEVADMQRGFQSRMAVAQFFLDKFLGAETAVDARDATKRFVKAVEMLVEGIPTPGRQAEIRMDLSSELKSRKRTLTPSQFAHEHLAPEEIPPFENALRETGTPRHFTKDTALVSAVVSKLRAVGEGGMILVGPTDEWRSRVTFADPPAPGEDGTIIVRDNFRIVR